MSEREIQFELLRPQELIDERERCPLVFLPVAPIEYHGPHMPIGTDPINATQCALETCRRLGKGVVMPTLYWGTERERPSWMAESLGFSADDWVYGMDFPSVLWESHYYQEHIFGIVVSEKLQMLIRRGYKVIMLINGHGAWNHMETLKRLALYYSNTEDVVVKHRLAFALDVSEENLAGHADLYETSLLMYYHKERGVRKSPIVDLTQLPQDGPLHYKDFSIVDGAGFSRNPSPGHVVQTDPRKASVEKGREVFEQTIEKCLTETREAMEEKGLA